MSRCNFGCNRCCIDDCEYIPFSYEPRRLSPCPPRPCPPPPCPPRPCPPPPYPPRPFPPSAPFTSSYIEAVGNTQSVAGGEDFKFAVDAESLDIAGGDIELDATGTVFTIKRAGLYRVEWSINVATAESLILVGLLENGNPSSALHNRAQIGNYSSGALINVGLTDVPFTISLHNFGGGLTLEDPAGFENVSLSIRISRFADGAALPSMPIRRL